jgi:hypothetical protein
MSVNIIPFLSETDGAQQRYIVRQVVDGHEVRQQVFDTMDEAEKVADEWKATSGLNQNT